MKKTVLVPTDFSVASLNALKSMLSKNPNLQFNIIFVHGYSVSDGISDLLFFSKRRVIDSICGEEFNEACVVLKNKFENQIGSIRKEIFSGFTNASFRNFAEANKVDEVCILSNFKYNPPSGKSFDLSSFVRKSNLPVVEIPYPEDGFVLEKDSMAELFFVPNVSY